MQHGGIQRRQRVAASHGGNGLQHADAGGILPAPDARMDDRRRLAGDAAQQDRGERLRDALQSACVMTGLTALLDPRRIALVGASESTDRAASRPLRFLRDGGFSGDVYPVSASRSSVGGSRAWPSL